MVRRLLVLFAALIALCGVLASPAAAPAVIAAPSSPVASRPGLAWTAEDATSGTAVLTYDNVGCVGVDVSGFCTSGAWPSIAGAKWIWRTQNVSPGEAAGGTPWVTFTDTFPAAVAGGVTTLTIAADDEYVVSVNGTNVGAGGLAVQRYRFRPNVGANTLTVRVRSLAGPTDPYSSPAGLAYSLETTWTSTVSLTASRSVVTFGHAATLTAHLKSGSKNHTVSVYAQPVGGQKVLVAKGVTSAAGNLLVKVSPRRNTTYTATYAGGSTWTAATSKPVTVSVAALWSTRSVGGYATSGGYRLYHWTKTCRPPAYKGCPTQRFALTPAHPGANAVFRFQYRWKDHWYNNGISETWALNSKSVLFTFTWYERRGIIGVPQRIKATFTGDVSHARAVSHWVYWRITN